MIEECRNKTYIENQWLTDDNIDAFLKQVTFVIDEKRKADYIREIIRVNPKYIPEDSILDGIFNKIRDAQSVKKNNSSVEGEVVSHLRDVLYYDRFFRVREIRLMVLNSFINHDVMNTSPPQSFYKLIHRFDGIKQKELIEDCKLRIATMLYDKTCTEIFWELLNLIYETIDKNICWDVDQVFAIISNEESVKKTRLDALTVQYLISVMKEALQ